MNYELLSPAILEESYFLCKNRTIKGIPLVELRRPFRSKLVSLPFFDTVSIGKNKKEVLKKILKSNARKKIEIKVSEFSKDIELIDKELVSLGFYRNLLKGHIVSNLTSKEDMWSKFHKHTRNDIRKAKKSSLEVRKINSLKELKAFYKLYFFQMKKFGTPQHSFDFFKKYFQTLDENIYGLNCYKKNKMIASIILFVKEEYVYVAYNVSDDKFRKYRPNDLLYWESLKWSMENKIKYFDIGQVDLNPNKGSREESLYKFKRKWLGEIYRKFHYTRGFKYEKGKSNPLKRLRKIWSILPNQILRVLGPSICASLGY